MNRNPVLSILVVVVSLATPSLSAMAASTVSVTGYGGASGQCQTTFGQTCINQLQTEAEEVAREQADSNCQAQQGIPGELNCFANCNPPTLPPGTFNHFVSCYGNCEGECRLP